MFVMSNPVFARTKPVRAAPFLGLLIAFLCLFTALSALAEIKFPDHGGRRVIDEANLLSPAVEQDLELKLKGVEDATTDQFLIVTVNSLQGQDIADYGYQLGRHWKVGQSGAVQASNGQTYKDNGVILIIAPNERAVRIEVGYGLEPVITDAYANLIINRAIVPKFKTGDFEGGIVAGADQVIAQLSLERNVAIQKAQADTTASADATIDLPPWVIIAIIIFFLFFSRGWLPFLILNSLLSSGDGGDGGWSGGGGGGGGFGGGGGGFGGGGSSGSW